MRVKNSSCIAFYLLSTLIVIKRSITYRILNENGQNMICLCSWKDFTHKRLNGDVHSVHNAEERCES